MFNIQDELKKLPQKPGVYIMKDTRENIIYIGKAKNLKSRVRQYFQSSNHLPKVISMVPKINTFEYIITDTEVEALVLECNLIKKHKPRYNIMLKDDKTYPYIRVTTHEPYPRIFLSRDLKKGKGKYLGPYTSVMAVKETIDLMLMVWPLRRCTKNIPKEGGDDRPCLNYHIGQCKAPCGGNISFEEYQAMVNQALDFLAGKHGDVLKNFEEQMYQASENMEFEKAAMLRDKLAAVKQLKEKQKLDSAAGDDQDIIALAGANDDALIQIFYIRQGKMTGREHFMLKGVEFMERGEILTEFVTQYYSGTPFIPKEIIIEAEIDDREVITEWLSAQKGQKVIITVPQKGEKLRLVELVGKNALITFEQFGEQIKREQQRTLGALEEIQKAIGIEKSLSRIEAYDISNIQGYESVASMIVFEQGKPKRNDYRKFKIKSVIGPDDYASMDEVITRRFSRYIKEKNELSALGKAQDTGKFTKLPDILFIDGGKGQVSVAENALKRLDMNIPVCGMIKDENHNTRGLIFNGNEIFLKHTSEGFKLITRIQDEVHRFAIEYHRKLRAKAQIRSVLDDIEGIGMLRRKALMKHFGDINAIRAADVEQLRQVPHMNIPAAQAVYEFFRR